MAGRDKSHIDSAKSPLIISNSPANFGQKEDRGEIAGNTSINTFRMAGLK